MALELAANSGSIEDLTALAGGNSHDADPVVKDIDYLLDNMVGSGGWGQWMTFLVLSPIIMFSGLPLLLHMFAAFEPEHRCLVPDCDDGPASSNIFDLPWVQNAIPETRRTTEMLKSGGRFDSCHMYQKIDEGCGFDSFNRSVVVACRRFVYDNSLFEETLTTKEDLVCATGETKRRLLGTIMMVGLMLGSSIGGRLGDRFGRKVTMLGSFAVLVPAVVSGGYSNNYATYAALRLLSCTALPCIWVSNHTMLLELFGSRHRKYAVIVKDVLFPCGQMLFALIAYLNRHWTLVHVWTGAACALAFPTFFAVPESVRWLAINGRGEEAARVLLKVAQLNGKTVTPEQRVEVSEVFGHMENADGKETMRVRLNPLDMMRFGNAGQTLIVLFNWITVCVGTYTFLLNSTKLYGNVFVNFTLASLVGEIPGTITLFVTLKYFGRRFNLFYMQCIVGVCFLLMAFVPKEHNVVMIVLYLVGKCAAGSGFLMVWLITAELYPTNLRGQAVGVCSSVARVFGMAAPFVAQLAMVWQPLPMLLMSIPCLVSAGIVYLLPETSNVRLPQTMIQARELSKTKSKCDGDAQLRGQENGVDVTRTAAEQTDSTD